MLYSKQEKERRFAIPSPTDVDVEEYRSAFRRDYARLLHSPAFRRLQGKTQLFPTLESDFFRNRLTHSLEVAQIAKSIGLRLNNRNAFFKRKGNAIDLDLLEFAGLAHDLGHPPFGHNGEKALDDCMKQFGGFEGNAQTLRILTRLEKREAQRSSVREFSNSNDIRVGLNLCYRSLAAILKYDKPIPLRRQAKARLVKGYYACEGPIVGEIKRKVTGRKPYRGAFKTIECQVMDFADDIAYSTYDLEDSLKAGFLTPLSMLASDAALLDQIARKTSDTMMRQYSPSDVLRILLDIFVQQGVAGINSVNLDFDLGSKPNKRSIEIALTSLAAHVTKSSSKLGTDGHLRSKFTSDLVGEFIRGIEVDKINEDIPALTKIRMKPELLERVEVLKHFTFVALIMSPRVTVSEYRGYDIVRTIFDSLTSSGRKGHLLMPDDFQQRYLAATDVSTRSRLVCDFVAGMTDRYAVEFYGRLKSENSQTIFKPL